MASLLSDDEFNQITTELATVNQDVAQCFLQLSITVNDASHAGLNLRLGRLVRRRSDLQSRISDHLSGLWLSATKLKVQKVQNSQQNDSHSEHPPETATVLERLSWYQKRGKHQEALILSHICDNLEDYAEWEISFPKDR